MSRQLLSSASAILAIAVLVVGGRASAHAQNTAAPAEAPPTVYPIAIFQFQERGKECVDMGAKVTDILFAQLVANPDVYLVEREELKKLLQEMEISAAGLTDPKQATQIGQLTGAKILITGSVFQIVDKTYVVAKLIGTETSRVFGASAKGNATDALDVIVEQLAKSIAAELKQHGAQLVPAPVRVEDRIAALSYEVERMGERLGAQMPHPAIYIDVAERHVGQAVIDPAVETELGKICKELGFPVVEKLDADILLTGEGFSQFAARHGNFNSVKARVELKAVDRKTGQVLAVDRQTAVGVDLAELVASKSALQEATVRLSSRLIPAMLKTKAGEAKEAKKDKE